MLRLDRNSENKKVDRPFLKMSELGCHRYVQDADITDVPVFLHKVEVDLDMPRVLVLIGLVER
jgi:hypothetical protein